MRLLTIVLSLVIGGSSFAYDSEQTQLIETQSGIIADRAARVYNILVSSTVEPNWFERTGFMTLEKFQVKAAKYHSFVSHNTDVLSDTKFYDVRKMFNLVKHQEMFFRQWRLVDQDVMDIEFAVKRLEEVYQDNQD